MLFGLKVIYGALAETGVTKDDGCLAVRGGHGGSAADGRDVPDPGAHDPGLHL